MEGGGNIGDLLQRLQGGFQAPTAPVAYDDDDDFVFSVQPDDDDDFVFSSAEPQTEAYNVVAESLDPEEEKPLDWATFIGPPPKRGPYGPGETLVHVPGTMPKTWKEKYEAKKAKEKAQGPRWKQKRLNTTPAEVRDAAFKLIEMAIDCGIPLMVVGVGLPKGDLAIAVHENNKHVAQLLDGAEVALRDYLPSLPKAETYDPIPRTDAEYFRALHPADA